MAEGKRGFLQGLLQIAPKAPAPTIPLDSRGMPVRGPLKTHMPKVVGYGDNPVGWYPHRIKYKGLLDLDQLYKTMALWFKERRFELHETLYKSKPPEMEVNWRAERRKTSYIKEIVLVNVHMWGEYNIEAIVKGKKKKMADVRLIITVNGKIEAPYDDIFGKRRWNASNIERRLNIFFQRWVLERELAGLHWDRFYYELYDFYSRVKETLQFGAR